MKSTTATLNRHTQQSADTGEIIVTVFAAFPDGLNTTYAVQQQQNSKIRRLRRHYF